MTDWMTLWWVWAVVAVAFAILEVLLPAFIFLGFTIGGVAMAALVAMGLLPANAGGLLLIFALLSLLGYIGLRLILGNPAEQVKVIRHDINETRPR
jgi:inner membrane protein